MTAVSPARIRAMIAEAEGWREQHRAAKRYVEAAACDIRIRALYDALGEKVPKR